MVPTRIFYVANVDWFFVSHRLPLAIEAKRRGFEVYVLTKNTGKKEFIQSFGLNYIEVDFERSGKNPIKELSLIFVLLKLYLQYRPQYIHHISIKPALYGSIAAILANVKKNQVVNAISGLGSVFSGGNKSITRFIVTFLMKIAFGIRKFKFIFQNPDDMNVYRSMGFLTHTNFRIVKGSGVDLLDYIQVQPIKKTYLKVILPARMLYDKGILEFVQASKNLYSKYKHVVVFELIGGVDSHNPESINEKEIKSFLIPNYLIWKGHIQDMKTEFIQSDIVCLPSYREGLPKSLVEAMAIGRPIVTSNVPGCKECVINEVNGYIVPSKDSVQLEQAIDRLLSDAQLRITMGNKSREIMEKEMSLQIVLAQTFDFYKV
jgi:glycosyltransferase involved in cell wall biosynthesis